MPIAINRFSVIRTLVVFVGLIMGGQAMSLEQPDYTVVYQQGDIEFRQYSPYLVTETVVSDRSSYKAAANEGFRRLFRYISGDNRSQAEIAMTKPVQQANSQAEGEEVAMTAPVQYTRGEDSYRVSFVLPGKYTLETAPVPLDPRVRTVQVPGRMMAVVRYSGRWTQSNFDRYQKQLVTELEQLGVDAIGSTESAYYNAPFVPPFLRRNEVMVEVDRLPSVATDVAADKLAAY